jgi:chemotaxis protein CheC
VTVLPVATTLTQQDALREVANIGGGHAASMLARLVGGLGVMTEVPRVSHVDVGQLPVLMGGVGMRAVTIGFTFDGSLQGHLWWVLPAEDARRLGGRLLARPTANGRLSTEERGALAEAANIVASSCCTAIGQLLRARVVPSTPHLQEGDVGMVLGAYPASAPALVLDARFHSNDAPTFGGHLLLMLDIENVRTLLGQLRIG